MKPVSAYTAMQIASTRGNTGTTQTTALHSGSGKLNVGLQKISNALAADQTKLSSLGQLQNLLTQFQSILQGMGPDSLSSSVNLSDASIAHISSAGSAGSHTLQVSQLAQTQVLSTQAQKSARTAIGSGSTTSITIESGKISGKDFSGTAGSKKTITIDASNNSLEGIAAALKSAGIDAHIQTDQQGARLQINGASGDGQSLRISVSGDATLKKMFSFDPASTSNSMQETAQGKSAHLTLDGKAIQNATNQIDAGNGLQLSLQKTGSTSITVSKDSNQLATKVTQFVAAFNQLNNQLGQLQNGALKSDPALSRVQQQLHQVLLNLQSGQSSALLQSGITIKANGQLQVNQQQLQTAINQSPDKISALFNHQGQGLTEMLGNALTGLTSKTGQLQQEISSTTQSVQTKAKQQALLGQLMNKQPSLLASLYADQASNGTSATGTGRSLFDFLA